MRTPVPAIVIGWRSSPSEWQLSGVSLGWWDADLFFDGWWTFFLIAPAIVGILGNGPNVGIWSCL